MSRFVLVLLLLCGCYQPPSPEPGPSPVPPANAIEAAASRNIRAYPDSIAAVYEQLAVDLDAGRFSTAKQFADELERRAREARERTFAEFRESWGSSANWSAAADAEKCRQSAKGFRR